MTQLGDRYAFPPGYDVHEAAAKLRRDAGSPSPEALERGARMFRAEAQRQAEIAAREARRKATS